MTDRPPGLTADELWARYLALDEQLRRLVKTEQRLFHSQRELSRQLSRFDVLNRFATRLDGASDEASLLASAVDLVFNLFPFDQCVAFMMDEQRVMRAVLARAVAGREADSVARFESIDRVIPTTGAIDTVPRMGTDSATSGDNGHIGSRLLDFVCAVFAHPTDAPRETMPSLVLAIAEAGGTPIGFLAFRRLDAVISFHEELPTDRDIPFLQVLSQQIAAALTQTRLVARLKLSYEMLSKAQRDLVVRERLAALGELAAVVAHEVRNPLAVIFNSLAALGHVVPAKGQAQTLIEILDEEAHRLNQMVTDLIDFARPHAPRLAAESLETVVADAIEMARKALHETPIEVAIRNVGTVPRVNGDGRMLRQIVLNLLINARQATSGAEPIEVTLIGPDSDGDSRVVLEVRDHGSGIATGDLERVFEPFFTTKASGSGLGLAVVRRFAELHGGSVSVRSTVGDGSTFVVRLPPAA